MPDPIEELAAPHPRASTWTPCPPPRCAAAATGAGAARTRWPRSGASPRSAALVVPLALAARGTDRARPQPDRPVPLDGVPTAVPGSRLATAHPGGLRPDRAARRRDVLLRRPRHRCGRPAAALRHDGARHRPGRRGAGGGHRRRGRTARPARRPPRPARSRCTRRRRRRRAALAAVEDGVRACPVQRQDPGAPLVHEAVDTDAADRRVVRVHPAGPDGRAALRRPHGRPGGPRRQRALRRHRAPPAPAARRSSTPRYAGWPSSPRRSSATCAPSPPAAADPRRVGADGHADPSRRRRWAGPAAHLRRLGGGRESAALASGRATTRARSSPRPGRARRLLGHRRGRGPGVHRRGPDHGAERVVLPRRPAARDGREGLRRGRSRRGRRGPAPVRRPDRRRPRPHRPAGPAHRLPRRRLTPDRTRGGRPDRSTGRHVQGPRERRRPPAVPGAFGWSGERSVPQRDARISRISDAVSDGVLPTLTPAASRASFFACAVPDEPDTIAPAWPIVLPSGAVKPAT